METKYVLVMKSGKGLKIGLHEYSLEQAEERLKVVTAAGCKMRIMEKNKAYGI